MNGVLTLLITGSGPHLVAFLPAGEEWKGEWGDKDPKWDLVSEEVKASWSFCSQKRYTRWAPATYNWGYTCYTSYK